MTTYPKTSLNKQVLGSFLKKAVFVCLLCTAFGTSTWAEESQTQPAGEGVLSKKDYKGIEGVNAPFKNDNRKHYTRFSAKELEQLRAVGKLKVNYEVDGIPKTGFASVVLMHKDFVATADHCLGNKYKAWDVRGNLDNIEITFPGSDQVYTVTHYRKINDKQGLKDKDGAILKISPSVEDIKPVIRTKTLTVNRSETIYSKNNIIVAGHSSINPKGKDMSWLSAHESLYASEGGYAALFDGDKNMIEAEGYVYPGASGGAMFLRGENGLEFIGMNAKQTMVYRPKYENAVDGVSGVRGGKCWNEAGELYVDIKKNLYKPYSND